MRANIVDTHDAAHAVWAWMSHMNLWEHGTESRVAHEWYLKYRTARWNVVTTSTVDPAFADA